MFRSGAFDAVNVDEAEGVMGNGVVGHLMNFSYSIAPFVFLYWTFYPKKIQYLIPILMLVVVTFGTLVKYNIIGLLVTIFMFMMVYRKSLVKKALLFLVIFTVFQQRFYDFDDEFWYFCHFDHYLQKKERTILLSAFNTLSNIVLFTFNFLLLD